MTEKELWLEAARRWAENDRRYDEGGLCYSMDDLSDNDSKLKEACERSLQLFNDRGIYYFFFWPEFTCHEERTTAACLLAAMADNP